jgi:hypothetical protein
MALELEQSRVAWEQEAVALNQARHARRESEEARKANIEDLDKLGRAVSTVMAGLNVQLGPVLPETLVAEVEHLQDVVQELELSTTRQVVHE